MTKILEKWYKNEIQGLIFDLRNNPGGYLQGAVDIAGEFLNKGSVVVIEDRGQIKNDFKTCIDGGYPDGKPQRHSQGLSLHHRSR